MAVGFCVAMSSVMSQRLLLNIRRNFEERRTGISDYEDDDTTFLDFANSPTFQSGMSGTSDACQMTTIASNSAVGSPVEEVTNGFV